MTNTAPFTPGQTVRMLGDTDLTRTFTVTEVNSVGRTGKQFRCAIVNTVTGETLTGIAPSRLSSPFVIRTPKTYTLAGFQFRPEVDEAPQSAFHPGMRLAGLLKAPVAAELLDLLVEAAEKGTAKAHSAVVLFCVALLTIPAVPAPEKSLVARLLAAFTPDKPVDPIQGLLIQVAKVHADEVSTND